ncbi:helix-turn-helix domain-containing protein [Ralstonia sp. CHL-2022]|uniref:helix-turn-helix domain-containing protein n=1 Tax=Ralstonia mojiangensis TaxID=2953895 RepID=UPI0021B30B92|nr:helix-turn-helix domain-containing protein [Ralstonia mojiangensis]MCT7295192.1 helix-turn-helix domain-containing protein [Ralstonia mojiangensis]
METNKKAAPNEESAKSQKQTESSPNSAAAQRERILSALRNGPLTTLQARSELDTLHPAARIQELRGEGHLITTVWTWDFSAAGFPHRVARYVLTPEASV